MDGYILTYNSNLTSKEITELNYHLFGKILTKKGKKYYYPGLFDSQNYFRFTSGCYFIEQQAFSSVEYDSRINCFAVKISLEKKDLTTAKIEKRKRYEGTFVRNL